jgi:hypothetical protein
MTNRTFGFVENICRWDKSFPIAAPHKGRSLTLCHPDRTRISYHAAPKMTSCAAFIKESRMNFVEPIALNRKSGGVEGSAILSTSN